MVGLGICVTTGFQQVRVCPQRDNKIEIFSTFDENTDLPGKP